MSVREIKKELIGKVPGIENLIMRYSDGGKTQTFIFADKSVSLPGEMQTPAIIEALRAA